MPYRGRIFEKCFKTSEKGTVKKDKMKDEPFKVAQGGSPVEFVLNLKS